MDQELSEKKQAVLHQVWYVKKLILNNILNILVTDVGNEAVEHCK